MLVFMIVTFLVIVLFLAVYFIPSFVAIGRKHKHVMQITLLDTFLGCTFIGWVAALIWASTDHVDESVKTKGSWIIIAVILVLSIMPLFVFTTFPPSFKSNVIQQSQYKSVIYKTKSGHLIKQVTESKHIQEN